MTNVEARQVPGVNAWARTFCGAGVPCDPADQFAAYQWATDLSEGIEGLVRGHVLGWMNAVTGGGGLWQRVGMFALEIAGVAPPLPAGLAIGSVKPVAPTPSTRIPVARLLNQKHFSLGPAPANASNTLHHVDTHGVAQPNHGLPKWQGKQRPYGHDGRDGTGFLPGTDVNGDPVTYHEYDVNPFVKGVNRGGERLVVGSDGSAYYTNDHYRSWQIMR